MSQIDELPPLREVIAKHDLRAKKELGQNFLLDLNLTSRIARVGGSLEDVSVIEVGPGPGGLTRALLCEGAKKVIVIEKDERTLPALEEISAAYPNRLEVILGDALEIDYAKLCTGRVKIIANLPYNIATPLLTGWLSQSEWRPFYESLTLMFQQEVANRICAKEGSKTYGRLSVLSGWRTNAHIAFNVDRNAFTPAPKVTSSIVHLEPRDIDNDISLPMVENITRAAFGQRRKMLRQSLKSLGLPVDMLLEAAELKGTERAEELPISVFLALAKAATKYKNS
jgi:16S rRNA (adenine1518-N6/adenine1519-N6)-dimethyltransferase